MIEDSFPNLPVGLSMALMMNERAQAEYGSYVDEKEKTAYWEMTVDYGRRNMQMYIDWAQSCIDRLEGKV